MKLKQSGAADAYDPANAEGNYSCKVSKQPDEGGRGSLAQLPPRQSSTTRNGGTTRNQPSKVKSVNLNQRSLNIKSQQRGLTR